MNLKQREAFEAPQARLRSARGLDFSLPNDGENNSHLFTKVDGVTVVIGMGGGYQLPAVRSYPETTNPREKAIDAAVAARFWFDRQARTADAEGKGHVNPTVDTESICGGGSCPCSYQNLPKRKRRSLK
jgi:hypothetical protein